MIGARNAGVVKHVFKIVGERRVMAFVEVPNHDVLDDMIMGQLPLAHHLEINMIAPVRDSDSFATAVKRRFAPD